MRRRRWERMKKMGIINCDLSQRDTDTIPGWNLKAEQLADKVIGPGEAARAVAWDTLTDEQKIFSGYEDGYPCGDDYAYGYGDRAGCQAKS